MTNDLSTAAVRDWAASENIPKWDEGKLAQWREFHKLREAAMDSLYNEIQGDAIVRRFIKRCEELNMPYTAMVFRGYLAMGEKT